MKAPNFASRNHWPRLSLEHPRAFQVESCHAGSFHEASCAWENTARAIVATAMKAIMKFFMGHEFNRIDNKKPAANGSCVKKLRFTRHGSVYARNFTAVSPARFLNASGVAAFEMSPPSIVIPRVGRALHLQKNGG